MSILSKPETIIPVINEEISRSNLHAYFFQILENQKLIFLEGSTELRWVKDALDLAVNLILKSRASFGKDLREKLLQNSMSNNRLRIELAAIPEEYVKRKFTETWPLQENKEIIDLSSEEYQKYNLLGLYIPEDKKIILDDNKIKLFAQSKNLQSESVLLFVFIHELMHFLMDPSNHNWELPKCGYPDNSISSFWMEESYANGLMLKMINAYGDKSLFSIAKFFVKSQPDSYKLGLQLMKKSIDYQLWIKEKVLIATRSKSSAGPIYLISCSSRKWKGKMPARVLYSASILFNYSYLFALKNNASKIFILSDKHHLISKDKLLVRYNKKLSTIQEWRKWYKKVDKQLHASGITKNFASVVILTGQKYYDELKSIKGIAYITPLKGKRIGQALRFLKISDKF